MPKPNLPGVDFRKQAADRERSLEEMRARIEKRKPMPRRHTGRKHKHKNGAWITDYNMLRNQIHMECARAKSEYNVYIPQYNPGWHYDEVGRYWTEIYQPQLITTTLQIPRNQIGRDDFVLNMTRGTFVTDHNITIEAPATTMTYTIVRTGGGNE